jgi:hypothetical protein
MDKPNETYSSMDKLDNDSSLPWGETPIPIGYEMNLNGLFKASEENKSDGFIASPVWIESTTVDAHSNQYGIVICWLDLKKNIQKKPFDKGLLHDRTAKLVTALVNHGLHVPYGKSGELMAYLSNASYINENYVKSVSNLGWLSLKAGDGKLTYVLPPDKLIGEKSDEEIIFKPERHSPTINTIKTSGTLGQWQTHVADKCAGNPFLVFSLCVGLAAPLLKLANMESGGFHFYGHSSRGKTTSAQVSASVFGCGADPAENAESAYIQRWNSTVNALEGLAAAHNHGLLVLDELHTCDSKDFGKVVYNLFGGKGKSRMNQDAELQQSRVWRLLLLSTGEKSSQDHIQETRQQVYAGQKVRLMDIPTGNNIVVDTKGLLPDIFTRDLKKSCSKYYGTAIPAFIEWLASKYQDFFVASHIIDDLVRVKTDELAGDKCEPEHRRAIMRLALVYVAGQLAVDAGILKLTKDEIKTSVLKIKQAWSNDSVNLPDYIQGAIKVQEFTTRHASRFMGKHDISAPRDLAGFHDNNCYMFTTQGFTEACGGFEVKSIARYLSKLGYLLHDSGRLQNYPQTPKGKIRCYTLRSCFLSHNFITSKRD